MFQAFSVSVLMIEAFIITVKFELWIIIIGKENSKMLKMLWCMCNESRTTVIFSNK